jgi:hypothetical protein
MEVVTELASFSRLTSSTRSEIGMLCMVVLRTSKEMSVGLLPKA